MTIIFFFDINRRTEIHRDSPSKTWGVRAGFWYLKWTYWLPKIIFLISLQWLDN